MPNSPATINKAVPERPARRALHHNQISLEMSSGSLSVFGMSYELAKRRERTLPRSRNEPMRSMKGGRGVRDKPDSRCFVDVSGLCTVGLGHSRIQTRKIHACFTPLATYVSKDGRPYPCVCEADYLSIYGFRTRLRPNRWETPWLRPCVGCPQPPTDDRQIDMP